MCLIKTGIYTSVREKSFNRAYSAAERRLYNSRKVLKPQRMPGYFISLGILKERALDHHRQNAATIIPTIPRAVNDAKTMLIASVTETLFSIIRWTSKNFFAWSSVIFINVSISIESVAVSHFGSCSWPALVSAGTSLGSSILRFLVKNMMMQSIRKRSNVPARKAKVSICSRT